MKILKKIFDSDEVKIQNDRSNSENNQTGLGRNRDFMNLIDEHFLLQETIQNNYKNRENPENLEKAIKACKDQILISSEVRVAFSAVYKNAPLPRHIGYEQLAIFEEKQKNYEEAIRISKIALSEKWSGDWQKRIDRCKRKLEEKQ